VLYLSVSANIDKMQNQKWENRKWELTSRGGDPPQPLLSLRRSAKKFAQSLTPERGSHKIISVILCRGEKLIFIWQIANSRMFLLLS
jgi:hypothetical protein